MIRKEPQKSAVEASYYYDENNKEKQHEIFCEESK